MSDVIIKVENLTKTFKLYNHPKDRLKEALSPFRKKYHHEFHALKDISFEIRKGESVGILGKNGAGKSTLLKVLTGVLTPTSGKVFVHGRIAALLELGSGFNPDLSGMENIYFQGAIMGLAKEELESKVSEIVEFADIGEFIDQPVKTYSSGMFARLAFSIAINVDPDILIVDEALSVGDVFFQAKCFMRFQSFLRSNKTIIFVSHDSQQVIANCTRAMLISDGSLSRDSVDIKGTVLTYERLIRKLEINSGGNTSTYKENFNPRSKITDFSIFNSENRETDVVYSDEKIKFEVTIESLEVVDSVVLGVSFKNSQGQTIFGVNTLLSNKKISLKKGITKINFKCSLNLQPNNYLVYVGLADITGERIELDQKWEMMSFKVISEDALPEGYVFSRVAIETY